MATNASSSTTISVVGWLLKAKCLVVSDCSKLVRCLHQIRFCVGIESWLPLSTSTATAERKLDSQRSHRKSLHLYYEPLKGIQRGAMIELLAQWGILVTAIQINRLATFERNTALNRQRTVNEVHRGRHVSRHTGTCWLPSMVSSRRKSSYVLPHHIFPRKLTYSECRTSPIFCPLGSINRKVCSSR